MPWRCFVEQRDGGFSCARRQVCIAHRHLDRGVSEQLLDLHQVRPAHHEMGGVRDCWTGPSGRGLLPTSRPATPRKSAPSPGNSRFGRWISRHRLRAHSTRRQASTRMSVRSRASSCRSHAPSSTCAPRPQAPRTCCSRRRFLRRSPDNFCALSVCVVLGGFVHLDFAGLELLQNLLLLHVVSTSWCGGRPAYMIPRSHTAVADVFLRARPTRSCARS